MVFISDDGVARFPRNDVAQLRLGAGVLTDAEDEFSSFVAQHACRLRQAFVAAI